MNIREIIPSGKSNQVPVKRDSSPLLSLQNEMNRLFRDFFGETWPHWSHAMEVPYSANPAMDVAETDKEFKISLEVPGMDAKDFTITLNDQYVTIKGEKKEEKKEEREGYFRQERSYGEFQRVIAIPSNIMNAEKAEANVSKGVLTITVPKKADAQSKTRQIEVKQAA